MASDRVWLAGASAASFRSELRFDGEADYTLRQSSYALSFGRRLGERASAVVSGGLVRGGTLEGEGRRYAVGTGWLASATGAYQLLAGGDGEPFAVATLSLGYSRTHVQGDVTGEDYALSASDLRLGAELGVTVLERLRPFALARAFGGPVMLDLPGESRTGSDRHHYALGLGVSADATSGIDVRFESALLGERAFVWSAALAF